jgi:hypothetical protein
VFRYALFAHARTDGRDIGGQGEIGGNDILITLGGWGFGVGHRVGNVDQQAALFMHELGHNLAGATVVSTT